MEYEGKKRRTRREVFLERMDGLIPWERLETRIRPFYPKAGRGRRPYPLSVMLRIHCVQLFYNMSDPGMEDMLCEVESVRRFTGVRLSGPIPDETTILNFRHLLERHGLGRGLFEEINAHLAGRGYRVRRGTIVDATIIAAPSSTHSVRTTPANTHDLREAGSLLHGGEEEVWADSGYRGIERWVEAGGRDVRWTVAMAPGRRRLLDPEGAQWRRERAKASVRAKGEHPFLYLKRHFGYREVRYRGLAKNTERIALLRGCGHRTYATLH